MPYLHCHNRKGEQKYPLDKNSEIIIGRSSSSTCTIRFPEDRKVSRTHCTIKRHPSEFYEISDCNSTNGTYVNREKIGKQPVRLNHGDRIRVGENFFVYSDREKNAAEKFPFHFEEISQKLGSGKNYSSIFHEIIKR